MASLPFVASLLDMWAAWNIRDWVAIFAFGLITNSKFKNNATPQEVDVGQDLLTLWSAFFLMHLGGPFSITAYVLEDNALWLATWSAWLSRLLTGVLMMNLSNELLVVSSNVS
ncbi:hypothetical protein MLD38_037684 [Melastoma candidum]|uniref:Uncharacterized protein n=1 Tax=Melastoma candidum TaxID=119954 RepID=A0ACB9LNL1_9MYRT|nr:hypothetical protein MLD38_037684 [Melastoma candidum]